MSDLFKQMATFSAAEEFLNFFNIEYEQSVVNVNRLHILKRFNQYLRATPDTEAMDDAAQRDTCRELLIKAYGDFVKSTPAQEKVFKVFQDTDGKQHVTLDSLRTSLPSHH